MGLDDHDAEGFGGVFDAPQNVRLEGVTELK
jgi:hypothetical protein